MANSERMTVWRPYEPCREHEEQARRERAIEIISAEYGMQPIDIDRATLDRAGALRQRIAEARKQ